METQTGLLEMYVFQIGYIFGFFGDDHLKSIHPKQVTWA